jgi:single-strand DNA-binding protein
MNSFTLTAVGNLARNPEAVAKGDITFTRFCLVGNDYAGKDDEGAPREIVTTLWFVAFGALAESLVRGARKGDQLFVEARVRSNNWTDKQGEKQYDLDFVVQGFRYGAPGKIKREERKFLRQDDMHRGDERSNGRDHEIAAVTGGDGSNRGDGSSSGNNGNKTNGHTSTAQGNDGLTGNMSADQSSSGTGTANTDKGDRGASGSNGSHNSSDASGKSSERHDEKSAEKPSHKLAEKPGEKPSERMAEKLSQRLPEKASEKPSEKLAEKPSEKLAERATEKLAEKPSGSRAGRRAAPPPP